MYNMDNNNMDKTYQKLDDYDIKENRYMYDAETIEWNIRNSFLSMRILVRNQKLTPYICAKYVVFGGRNERWADCREDAWIASGEIPYFQPHITMYQMMEAHTIADKEDAEEDGEDAEKLLMKKEDINQ